MTVVSVLGGRVQQPNGLMKFTLLSVICTSNMLGKCGMWDFRLTGYFRIHAGLLCSLKNRV